MVLGTDKSMLACTVLQAWGNGGQVLDKSKIPWCLCFFLLFLALVAILFSRAGQFEQFW